jgi:hypothetical protein
MEFFAILLSTVIGLVSPAGFIVDQVAQQQIRRQFESVEQLQVRVDNVPSYQFAKGRAERVRIAGRGLFPVKEVRIEALELETDPIQVNLRRKLRLEQPVQAGVRLVLREADINRALKSPTVVKQLRITSGELLEGTEAEGIERFNLVNPSIDFLGNNRLRFQVGLQEQGYPDLLAIDIETGLQINSGRNLVLVNPTIKVNDKDAPPRLVKSIAEGLNEQLDLQRLEKSKILARVLQMELTDDQLNLATFIRVEPDFALTRKK